MGKKYKRKISGPRIPVCPICFKLTNIGKLTGNAMALLPVNFKGILYILVKPAELPLLCCVVCVFFELHFI